jgi:DNA-binding MarR family transcriptional regulator
MDSDASSSSVLAGLAKLALVLRHEAWQQGASTTPRGKSARRGAAVGLSPTQGQILAFLRGPGAMGVPMSEIAAALAITLPTVSESVSALERKELVTRERSSEDARRVLVRLTPSGGRAAARGERWPDSLMEAASSLDDGERDALLRCLVKMIRSLQESGKIPVARMCVSCTHFRPHAHRDADRPHHCAFVDAPFGDRDLRIDCDDHSRVTDDAGNTLWQLFVRGSPPGTTASPSRRRASTRERGSPPT